MKNACKYELTDRIILIRREQQRDEHHVPLWVWANPVDGAPHGSGTTEYVKFETLAEAETTAIAHGYEVVK